MSSSAHWLERLVSLLLAASFVGVLVVMAFGRRVTRRSPAPLPVYSSPVTDSVWEVLVSRGNMNGLPGTDAKDTLVVFSDYECPPCAAAALSLDSLRIERPHIAVLSRHLPLSTHPYAFAEAVAVECGARLGKFAEAETAMYNRGGSPLDPAEVAHQLGIDSDAFQACWHGTDAREAVRTDRTLARDLGLSRTPSAFFSGVQWSHLPDLDHLLGLVGPEDDDAR